MVVRVSRTILAGAALLAGVVAAARLLGRRGVPSGDRVFTDGPLPPVTPPSDRTGRRADRGRTGTVALDVDRLRTSGEGALEPVVQYLTYIQGQRDDEDHLMFVRYADLDALAEREGIATPTFLDRLDQLGVVVSNN